MPDGSEQPRGVSEPISVSVSEYIAARRLGLSVDTLRRDRRLGQLGIPFVKYGRGKCGTTWPIWSGSSRARSGARSPSPLSRFKRQRCRLCPWLSPRSCQSRLPSGSTRQVRADPRITATRGRHWPRLRCPRNPSPILSQPGDHRSVVVLVATSAGSRHFRPRADQPSRRAIRGVLLVLGATIASVFALVATWEAWRLSPDRRRT